MNTLSTTIDYLKNRFVIRARDTHWFSDNDQKLFDQKSDIVPGHSETRIMPKLSLLTLSKSLQTGTSYQKALHRANLTYAFIRCLSYLGAIRVYGDLAERLLPVCRKYVLADMGLFLCRKLVHRYSVFEYDAAKFKKYRKLRDAFQHEQRITIVAEDYYADTQRRYNKKKSHSREDIEVIRSYNNELKHINSDMNNPRFVMIKELMQLIECDIDQNSEKAKTICDRALDFFDTLSFDHSHGKRLFTNHFARSLVRLKEYDQAKEVVENATKYHQTKTHAWVRNREMLFMVHMRLMDVIKATEVLAEIESTTNLRFFGSEMRDRVYLYKLYLQLISGKTSRLKVHKIISDLPRYTHDTKGMNLSMITAELTHAALIGDMDFIRSQRSQIITYVNRYGADNPRTRCLIRLLIHLPDHQNDWHGWIKYTNRIFGVMKKTTDSIEELEIVDYEILWAKIADKALAKNQRYKLYKSSKEKKYFAIAGLTNDF